MAPGQGLSGDAIMGAISDLSGKVATVGALTKASAERLVCVEVKVDKGFREVHERIDRLQREGPAHCGRGDQHDAELRTIGARVDKIEQGKPPPMMIGFGRWKVSGPAACVTLIGVVMAVAVAIVAYKFGWPDLPTAGTGTGTDNPQLAALSTNTPGL